ncbi:MAG TPA: cysteine desulfurase [Tenericutes bacterium]|jgi:cysteine desulfurase|nr:cysteine desulfurase [Mycoplasmatota bacterium]
MIYLDYTATTKPEKEVLDTYVEVSEKYFGNTNSLHGFGAECEKLEKEAIKQIATLLGVKEKEIIYTSGATEANNLSIKGVAFRYQSRGRHIITTKIEHDSVYNVFRYLEAIGFDVTYLDVNEEGIIDIHKLNEALREDTILVSIMAVNSEIGSIQPIEEIGNILKKYPKIFFHVDATQAIGKINIDFTNIDLVSMSAHKFYGLKGSGILICKEHVELVPLMHGGGSLSVYRSGTLDLPGLVAFSKALRLALTNLNEKYNKVESLNIKLKELLKQNPNIKIISSEKAIPHILSISITGIKPETLVTALSEEKIYLSTKSACSSKKNEPSRVISALPIDSALRESVIRISLSYKTTDVEIEEFVAKLNKAIYELKFTKGGK